MTAKEFDEHIEYCQKRIKESLQSKGKEYARSGNRFHNFDTAARMDNITAEQALIGMMRKHEVSIRDMINDIENGIIPSANAVDEKFKDNINYLILLEGLVKRRMDKAESDRALKFHEEYCKKRDHTVHPYETEENLSHTGNVNK